MQVIAKTARARPPMAGKRLDTPSHCDICGKHRGTRKHDACSRIRQQRKSQEWADYMAEQAAKRTTEQESRHER